MPKSYSLDLRVRVHAFVEAGHSRRAAARRATAMSASVGNNNWAERLQTRN